MSDNAVLLKQLKVKSGSTLRLFKEHKLYQDEEVDLRRKLDKLIADNANNAEEWDIRNTRRMLEESQKMIADSASRLGQAAQELRELLLSAEQDAALAQDPELLKAQEALEIVSV
ncbi:tubulin binding cofactor A [Dichomitus squalens]|uniref:Tubulin-specific chaperone A n=1 Tax=Dichomitus squalens TaxID=114155 RepID=A0A4V2K1X5_9APHY|nr:tubulin binding cofactor A [Dichomitus squalens]